MLNFILPVLGCSAVLGMTAGLSLQAAPENGKNKEAAGKADTLPVLGLDGLPEVWLQGTPVKEWEKDKLYIFEFWATWCGPCLAAMPHMEQLHQTFKENNRIQLIGVNVLDNKSPDNLKVFLKNRPSPLTYTMAVDVDGKKTRAKWLNPLKVNGIPHAFAVKNGKLVWRGHPAKLSEELIQAMLKPDFSAASLPSEMPDASRREWELFKKTAETLQQLVRDQGRPAAVRLLEQIQESGQFQQDRLIQLKMIPFKVLEDLGHFEEAQAVLRDLTEEYPDNYQVQINVAGTLLEGGAVPEDKMDASLVERCLNRCIEISRKDKKEASLPWRMISQLRERQGRLEEALDDMEKAISLSSLGKAWTRFQQLSGDKNELSDVLDEVIREIKPEAPRKVQNMGAVDKSGVYAPLFKKLFWLNHNGLEGLPADKTVFITFWRAGVKNGRLESNDESPGGTLDIVLKKHGLLDHPNVRSLILSMFPVDEKGKSSLNPVDKRTPYPIGVPSDDSVAKLFGSLNLEYFPAAAVVRDGTLLWAGEMKKMPLWVAEEARRASFDKNRFAEEASQREARARQMQEVVKKSFELRKQKKMDEYIRLMEENAERFADNGWFSSTVAEIRAGKSFKEKNYQKAIEILDNMMARFPLEDGLAAYMLKIYRSSEEMQAYSYEASRRALQIMRDANTRGDGGYNAACYEVMMEMAMDKKDYAQARKDALNAFRELPLVRRYADLKKKHGKA